jgi:threonine aldolase
MKQGLAKMTRHIDFRSDTVTQPTEGMRSAMVRAHLGDDVFGDDPTVNAFQEKVADLLGYEAALFMPTGTQSNLCALMAHCGRGDEYLVGQMAHTYRWEAGGAAVLGSIQPQPLEQEADGAIALHRIEAAIKPNDAHFAMTRLLCLENTWNGKVLPSDYVGKATSLAHQRGLETHLDGARIWNAAVHTAQQQAISPIKAVRQLTKGFDSVSVCFSKGLGAPAGSVLCGSKALIAKAHRIRKMAGGAMRQTGMLAAAADYALDHHLDRLQDDHQLAQRLAKGLMALPGLKVEMPQTNMVFIELEDVLRARQGDLLQAMKAQGILTTGTYRLRCVTHLGLTEQDIDHALTVFQSVFA